MSQHLYCAISYHGFGHIAQTAPVLNRWFRSVIGSGHSPARVTLQCEASQAQLSSWFRFPFRHVPQATDPGLQMINAASVDAKASFRVYRREYEEWDQRLEQQTQLLREDPPDFVLTNNAYLVGEAAHRLGIPCMHFCSLNWAALFDHYCGTLEHSAAITANLIRAYNLAECFLRVTPGLPMQELGRVRPVGTVSRRGKLQDLSALTGHRGNRHVLVSMGGMPYSVPYEAWPVTGDMTWILTQPPPASRTDMIDAKSLGLTFIDLLASSDAVLTKPGYGTFAEAVTNHIPLLYLQRDDWPETPYLTAFIQRYGLAAEISPRQLRQGDFADALNTLWATDWPQEKVPGDGAAEIADIIQAYL